MQRLGQEGQGVSARTFVACTSTEKQERTVVPLSTCYPQRLGGLCSNSDAHSSSFKTCLSAAGQPRQSQTFPSRAHQQACVCTVKVKYCRFLVSTDQSVIPPEAGYYGRVSRWPIIQAVSEVFIRFILILHLSYWLIVTIWIDVVTSLR